MIIPVYENHLVLQSRSVVPTLYDLYMIMHLWMRKIVPGHMDPVHAAACLYFHRRALVPVGQRAAHDADRVRVAARERGRDRGVHVVARQHSDTLQNYDFCGVP